MGADRPQRRTSEEAAIAAAALRQAHDRISADLEAQSSSGQAYQTGMRRALRILGGLAVVAEQEETARQEVSNG